MTGDMEYTESSYFNVVRDMSIAFQGIPADASVKMPDGIMDLLEPYNYGNWFLSSRSICPVSWERNIIWRRK